MEKMKFELIRDSFKHYIAMYDVMKRFDRPMNPSIVSIIILLADIFNKCGMHRLVSVFIKPIQTSRRASFTGYVFSKNHFFILKSLRNYGIDVDAIFIGIEPIEQTDEKQIYVSDKRLFLEALKSPNLADLLRKSQQEEILKRNFTRIFKLIGCYHVYGETLGHVNSLINFNDHTPYSVLLALMAKRKKLKTTYIQHASVSDKFPALYHEYNILFCEDSSDKYSRSEGVEVFILFDPRFSNLDTGLFEKTPNKKNVLICTNLLDRVEPVLDFATELVARGYQVTLRPHPRDKRNEWGKIPGHLSTNDSIWEDLKENNIMVTNESAVILEGIFLKRKVFKASFFSETLDNYGYLKKGLILNEHQKKESLISAIEHDLVEYNVDKLNYFVGNLDDDFKRVNDIFDYIKNKKD